MEEKNGYTTTGNDTENRVSAGQDMWGNDGRPEGSFGEEGQRQTGAGEIRAARKHFSKLGGMFILGTIVTYVVQIIPVVLVKLFKPQWLLDGNIALLISMLPMYLIGMPVLILLVRTVPKETVERHRMKAGSFVIAVIMCYAIVYISNIIGNIMTAVIGFLKGGMVQNQVMDVTQSVSMWMILLYMVICAPIMEEFVFRKLIVDRTVRYGQGAAVVLSGLMFGLFHGNLNQFMYAFVLGMFLAFLYVKTGNIKITIALHMLINFVGGIVSSWLMRNVDTNAYLRVVESGDMGEMMAFVQENIGWLMGYGVFLLFIVGMMIAGSVLLIVNLVKHRFVLERGKVVIPKGKRFGTMIGNVGMGIYCVFWTVMIIAQLFE